MKSYMHLRLGCVFITMGDMLMANGELFLGLCCGGGGGVILNFDLICRIKTYESEKCFYVTGILNETFATV